MRRLLVVAGLAALAAIVTLLAATRDRDARLNVARVAGAVILDPGAPYVPGVDHDQATFDLKFEPNTRYVAVVSSLVHSTGSFTVAASARAIDEPEFVPRLLAADQSASREVASARSTSASSPIVTSHRIDSSARPKPRPSPPKSSIAGRAPAARAFALHVTDGSLDDASQYATVSAHEVAAGQNVRVYLDDQQAPTELAPGLVQSIADLFDGELIPRFRGVFGTYRDVDGDGHFSVLLSPWLTHLQGGRTSIGGFVRGSDFQPQLAAPFSNRCDMMYVNSQSVPGAHLRTLLIHEYTHAVSFSRRTGSDPAQPTFPEEEDWLNEALAHCAESLFGGGWTNLDYRISRYLNDTAAYPLVVEDYYRAGLWRCHGCRGATYLFLRYCVERFGTQILTRLIATPARGTQNLELATGCPFDRLFRDWTLSLLEDVAPGAASDRQSNSPTIDRAANADGYRMASLDLRGALGQWGLAGPRPRAWDVDSGPLAIELKGTSVAFVDLSAARQAGWRRIQLGGTKGMQLQVSLLRLPDKTSQIDVDAVWSRPASGNVAAHQIAGSQSPPDDVLRIGVRVAGENNVAIEQVAAEQNAGEDRMPICYRGDAIKAIEVVTDRHAEASRTSSFRAFELPARPFRSVAVPVIVKVVVVDREGRRSAGWATVRERAPQQMAAVAPTRR